MSVRELIYHEPMQKYSLKELKSATTLSDVAKILGFKSQSLSYLLYKKGDAAKYKTFEIPKRYGGTRKISAPSDELKLLQQRISLLFQDCKEEIDKAAGYQNVISHGFEPKRSIITNARRHRNRRYVFNIDLEGFFDSIHLGRVRGFLIKDKRFELHPKVATVISQIACFNDGLPQGSPCSPVLANLIAHVMDVHVLKLAAQSGCTYTRYADDLTFSTNQREVPSTIAFRTNAAEHAWTPGKELQRLIERSGFKINAAKTRMQYYDSRQEVTGLVVNKKVNVRSEYRHTVRAMVYSLFTTGHFDLRPQTTANKGKVTLIKEEGTIDQLHGMLGFINTVDLYNSSLIADDKTAADMMVGKEAMYRRFLLYKWFYTADSPTIVCEGITDNVYLLHAIRALSGKFSELATVDADGTIKLKVRFFRYPHKENGQMTSTGRILGLTGGAPCLGQMLLKYKNEVQRFTQSGKTQPVILVLDNDGGAKSVYSIIKIITGSYADKDAPFIHIVANMYLVATPRKFEKDSKIEDCFTTEDKARKLDGKSFDDNNDYSSDGHYGKVDFAHKVVRTHADTIDFSGFNEILTNILAVIAHRAASLNA